MFEKRREKHISAYNKTQEQVIVEQAKYTRLISNITELKIEEEKAQFLQTLCELKQLCQDEYKQLIKNWQKWDVESTKEFLRSAIDQTMTDVMHDRTMNDSDQDDCQKLILFIKKCILDSGEAIESNDMNDNDMLKSDGDMCIICLESKANMPYTDSGHMSWCQRCYQEWSKDKTYCPQCRKNSNKAIKVFVTGYCQ